MRLMPCLKGILHLNHCLIEAQSFGGYKPQFTVHNLKRQGYALKRQIQLSIRPVLKVHQQTTKILYRAESSSNLKD